MPSRGTWRRRWELDAVYLYNLDDLQQVVLSTQGQRREAVESARKIVARQVEEFLVWHRQRELGPTIDRLYRYCHTLGRGGAGPHAGEAPDVGEAERPHWRS